MPLAAGIAFLVSYCVVARPQWKPANGGDWLFWLAIPLTLIASLDAAVRPRLGWLAGALAGVVAFILLKPLSASVPAGTIWTTSLLLAVAGVALAWTAQTAARNLGPTWTLAAFTVATAGAGVVIFSSNYRTFGLHGLAAAAALAPIVLLTHRTPAAVRATALFAGTVLAGLLVAGHFYPDPGVTRTNLAVLFASPLLLLTGVAVPWKTMWVRGAVGLLASTIAVAAVTAPTAIKAKKAAESVDPLDSMYR